MAKVVLTVAGTGNVASVVLGNGKSYTLNSGAVLTSGALYEFEIHVPPGYPGVEVTGGELQWTTLVLDD